MNSFRYAFRGLRLLLVGEHNAWLHLVATLLAVGLGLFLSLGAIEWAILVLAIATVWTAEALNAAIERLGDAVSASPHPLVGAAKDLGAGGVLASAIGAMVVGVLILGPRMASWISCFLVAP